MSFLEVVNNILNVASSHNLIKEVHYGSIYDFENSGDRKYSNFVLTENTATRNEYSTIYNFTAFVTDRLLNDESNKLEVQSLSKTILEEILLKLENVSTFNFTFWTDKFTDICAGCYCTFDIEVPNEMACVDEESFKKPKGIPYAIIFTTADPPSSSKVAVIKALRAMTVNEKASSGWPLKIAKAFYEQTQYSSLDFAAHNGYEEEYFNRELSEDSINQFMQVAEEGGVAEYIQIIYK